MSTESVDAAETAGSVPESTAVNHCAVVVVVAVGPRVVVAVIRREHHPVVVLQCIASIARVPRYPKQVVARLAVNNEQAVLGVVPAGIGTCLQVSSQLVAAVLGQLTEQFVAEPVVSSCFVEPDFELIPRTVEEFGSIDVLLNQQWDTVGCCITKIMPAN